VIERRPLDLVPLLKEMVKLWQRVMPETITVQLVTEPGQFMVNADLTRLQQALMNLMVNAKDAMPNGGVVTLRLRIQKVAAGATPPLPEMPSGDWVCLSVTDTGTGIPAEVLSRIFEPFYTTKPRGKGTGLGLAQVHGIIKQHGGYIGVESQEGHGTTFTLYLPLYVTESAHGSSSESTMKTAGAGERILVVEDNEVTLLALQQGLEELGGAANAARWRTPDRSCPVRFSYAGYGRFGAISKHPGRSDSNQDDFDDRIPNG
jgi:two-component system cell cycle sensor histidine kinase/response regulator CckA